MMETNEIIDEFQSRQDVKKNGGTGRRYADLTRKFILWLDTEKGKGWKDVETSDVRVWLREMLQDGDAPSSVKTAKSAISQFYQEIHLMYEEGVDVDKPPENPIKNLDISDWKALNAGTLKSQAMNENVHYLTPDKIEELVENVNKPKPRNRLLIRLSYQTGCRNGEIRKIRLNNIDLNKRRISVRKDKTTDNEYVYYQPSLDDALRLWIDIERNSITSADYAEIDPDTKTISCEGKSDYLFPTNRKEYISSRQLNRIVSEAADDAGLQRTLYTDNHKNPRERRKISHHSLRHSFAVQSLKNGMNIRTLQKLLGHENIDTTMKYLRIAEDDAAEEARRFGAGTESL